MKDSCPTAKPVAPKKALLLGSGALSIGQAGEFDYSGSQAVKALVENGIETILVNPNIATIQTTTQGLVKTYLYPINVYWVEQVIRKERPDAIVYSFGGQTALNCVLELEQAGVLSKYGVKTLGTSLDTLRLTEDRDFFAKEMKKMDTPVLEGVAVYDLDCAVKEAEKIGYPVIVRAAYALGGLGSGFAYNTEELKKIVREALDFSPQVLIEKSIRGWKEVEYEVMRDREGNVITICNMENLDPLGVHTGDSIVVAPSQTLTDSEYQLLRNTAIKIVGQLEVIGECNVQYALDPQSEQFYVIEVNARLSRSSALASKATGYPIAYIAAQIILGHSLVDLKNPLTQVTSAFYEPALDYCILKIPRWDLDKFPGTSRKLGSAMKSVGEVMAIGRNFAEVLQKAVRMSTEDPLGVSLRPMSQLSDDELIDELRFPTDQRLMGLFEIFHRGKNYREVNELTQITTWFLDEIEDIVLHEKEFVLFLEQELNKIAQDVSLEQKVEKCFTAISQSLWSKLKRKGFSDAQLLYSFCHLCSDQTYSNLKQPELTKLLIIIRGLRKQVGVVPAVKKIDTTAAEYPSPSNYLYMSYEGQENDSTGPNTGQESFAVLGSGSYRIGSSVEFDWCGVHCAEYLRRKGKGTIIINCNPETVSTDYNTSDKLYFEEMTLERVLDVIDFEKPKGVFACMGGQLPNNLIAPLEQAGAPMLGHSARSLLMTEGRDQFSKILDKINIDQPKWISATDQKQIDQFLQNIGFPVLVRPSFVLSGTAMKVAENRKELEKFLAGAAKVSSDSPVVISEFIMGALEVEYDGVATQGNLLLGLVSEHLEPAGVHSGDSTLIHPPQNLNTNTQRKIHDLAGRMAAELNLNGPFNVQFLLKDETIKVIECNARASRSFPFISKVTGVNLADLATQVMMKSPDEKLSLPILGKVPHVGVKAPMFSFHRLQGVDPVLGVEMASTGEVGCLGSSFLEALLLALESTGINAPKKGILVSSGRPHEKKAFLESMEIINKLGLPVYATQGTADFLKQQGHEVVTLGWPSELGKNVLDAIQSGEVDLVINVPKNLSDSELKYGGAIRRMAIQTSTSLITNMEMVVAFFQAINQNRLDESFYSRPLYLPEFKTQS